MANVLNINVGELEFHKNEELGNENLERFRLYVERRLAREPVSKIINLKAFWNHDFFVNRDVLDPRQDSETMIEAILKDFPESVAGKDRIKILELGVGSGCLLLTLLKIFKNAEGIGIDIDEKALSVAQTNAKRLDVKNVNFMLGNWNDNLTGYFDIVLSNPPYVKTDELDNLQDEIKFHEPGIALDGGQSGLECFCQIAGNIGKNVNKQSKIYIEIGQNQDNDVINIFKNNNFKLMGKEKDLGHVNRILVFALDE
ncbi:release factor glutamine methyltransferase [Bacilli bacterium]|nr:release factor glutamine methyltransferase [Bacilli bacterium]